MPRVVREVVRSAARLALKRPTGFSQFGEDQVIARLLPQPAGRYLDVGAYHPHVYSNTFLLYRRGWSGVAVDPNPDCELLFRIFRPRDTFIRAGTGPAGRRVYYRYSDGAYNGFAPSPTREGVVLLDAVETEVRPLSSLVPPGRFDLLNVDVEGMDLEVLRTFDWSDPPEVVAVEGSESDAFLRELDYALEAECGLTRLWLRRR
ncbi:MAG: FkbM family methyltransferase [Gaiellaceae bacterium]